MGAAHICLVSGNLDLVARRLQNQMPVGDLVQMLAGSAPEGRSPCLWCCG